MRKISGVLCVILASLMVAAWAVIPTVPDEERMRPSGTSVRFDKHLAFASYVAATRANLHRARVFHDASRAEIEVDGVSPFEWTPDEQLCQDYPSRGVLLVHGLSDSPFLMRDLASEFQRRCFLVRAVLLPGHGTRPGDLLHVSHTDWEQAVEYSLEQLSRDVDQTYLAGFSLGGALATTIALRVSDIDGLFLFSPAVDLNTSLVGVAPIVAKFVDWLDVDPPDDFARYEAFPANAAGQIATIISNLEKALDNGRELKMPVFVAVSRDDTVVNVEQAEQIVRQYSSNPRSQLLVFGQFGQDSIDEVDERVRYLNSHLPDQRIEMMSHQSIPLAPDNPYYGRHGVYRRCQEGLSEEMIGPCLNDPDVWYTSFDIPPNADRVYARLTFNPRFEEMWEAIDDVLRQTTD